MRVITPLGFGEIEGSRLPSRLSVKSVEVLLDRPFLGKRQQYFSPPDILPFGDWGVIKILNVIGVGKISNLQFFSSEEEALRYEAGRPPPDETHILINIDHGTATVDQSLGLGAADFLLVHPWVDCWAAERGEMFDDREHAAGAFERELESIAGSTGVSASAMLSTRDGTMLWFYICIAPPQGVIFKRKFEGGHKMKSRLPFRPPRMKH
jgi:hypothetical protein